MTPNVLEAMKIKSTFIDPQKITWVDLGGFSTMSDDEYSDIYDQIPCPYWDEPEDLMMPFQYIGFARKLGDQTMGAVSLSRYMIDGKICLVGGLHGQQFDIGLLLENYEGIRFGNLGNIDLVGLANFTVQSLGETATNQKEALDILCPRWIEMFRHLYGEYMRRAMLKDGSVKAYKPIPNPSNPKRIRKGKKPIFEWRVIDVTAKPKIESMPTGRKHLSPRKHKRRGHLRHYKSGKETWVNECLVGKLEFGYIHHTYQVGAK